MSRLYTYLPKDNTALTEGLLSTALSGKGFEKYRGRTGKYNKEDVLKVLDSWEPEWTRSKAISVLTEPIPEDAAEDFLEFARNRRLYSFDTKDLIKAKILAHLRRARKGGGTDPVDEVREERPNWHRKKKHLLFQGVPHYMVETTGGRIPPEFVREEKRAGTGSITKSAGLKDPTGLKEVLRLVGGLIRNKPRPVPLRKIVDSVSGAKVFRGSSRSQLPFLQTQHAMKSNGLSERGVHVHVSPSVGVVSDYAGTYMLRAKGPGTTRRGGFLQVITSGLGDLKSGKQQFSHDFGAVKSTKVPSKWRNLHASRNMDAMRHPYDLDEQTAFEAILPARSLADAKVYATSVLPGFKGRYGKPDYDHIMLTDVTVANRLAKIRARHPEFAKYIDPVIGRYVRQAESGSAELAREIGKYRSRRMSVFFDPPRWQLPKHLRNSEYFS